MNTVKELRQNGYKVRVTHYRYYKVYGGDKKLRAKHELNGVCEHSNVLPNGGKTEITVVTPENKEFSGVSVCNRIDAFIKREGTRLALERALNCCGT